MTTAFHSMQYWSAIKIWTAHRINLNTYSEIDQNVNHVYWSSKVKWDFSSFCLSQDQIILDLAWALNPNTAVLIKERREIWHTQERPCEDRDREGTYATTDKEPPETGIGKEGSPRPPDGESGPWWYLISDSWPPQLWENKYLLFVATKLVVICCSSPGKLIHMGLPCDSKWGRMWALEPGSLSLNPGSFTWWMGKLEQVIQRLWASVSPCVKQKSITALPPRF